MSKLRVITIQFLDSGCLVETVALGEEIEQPAGPPATMLDKKQYACGKISDTKALVDSLLDGAVEKDTVH